MWDQGYNGAFFLADSLKTASSLELGVYRGRDGSLLGQRNYCERACGDSATRVSGLPVDLCDRTPQRCSSPFAIQPIDSTICTTPSLAIVNAAATTRLSASDRGRSSVGPATARSIVVPGTLLNGLLLCSCGCCLETAMCQFKRTLLRGVV